MKEKLNTHFRILYFTGIIFLFLYSILFNGRWALSNPYPNNKDIVIVTSKGSYAPGEKVIIKIKVPTKEMIGWGENNYTATIKNPADNIVWQETVTLSSLRFVHSPQQIVKFILTYQLPGDSPTGKYEITGILSQKDSSIIDTREIGFSVGIPTIEKFKPSNPIIPAGEEGLFKIVLDNPSPVYDFACTWQMDIIGPEGPEQIRTLSMSQINIPVHNKMVFTIPLQTNNAFQGDYIALLTLTDTATGAEYDQQEVPYHIGNFFQAIFKPNKKDYAPEENVSILVRARKIQNESLKSISITGEIRDLNDNLISQITDFIVTDVNQWEASYILPLDIGTGKYSFLGKIKKNNLIIGQCSKVFQVHGNIEIEIRKIKLKSYKKKASDDPPCISVTKSTIKNEANITQNVSLKAILEDLHGLSLGEETMELSLAPKKREMIKSIDFTPMNSTEKGLRFILLITNETGNILAKEEKIVHLED